MSAYCCVITVVALCYYYISMYYSAISVGNLCTSHPGAYLQYSFYCRYSYSGDRSSAVVKVHCYKLEGHWNFSLTYNPIALWPCGRLNF